MSSALAITVERSNHFGYIVRVNGKRARKWRSSSRCVYLRSGIVIKIGDQSARELQYWEDCPAEHRKFLAPIIAHGEVLGVPWVAMPRVRGKLVADLGGTHAKAFDRMLEVGKMLRIGDCHEWNAIWRRGDVVIVDYGCGESGNSSFSYS